MTDVGDYRQHLEVETPEHVIIDYEIAGLGSRALAALADSAVVVVLLVAIGVLALRIGPVLAPYLLPLMSVVAFAVLWGYFALFEGFMDGQTPGKRWVGIRVIRDTGHPVTLREAAARNLLRIADFLPPPYLLGALLVAFHPRGKRLGDLVAGTVVVRDHPMAHEVRVAGTAERAARTGTALPVLDGVADVEAGAPLLNDAEFRVVREFAARAPELPRDVRSRLAATIVERLAARFPAREADDETFLRTLHRDEVMRRRGRFAVRGAPGRARGSGGAPSASPSLAVRQTTSGASAERMVARKSGQWDAFGAMAARAQRGGLDALGAGELPAFAARYREVASDLARARTYGADPTVRGRLERLVAAGHNLLYRDDRKTWRRTWHFLAVECPAAVVTARRVVVVAFLSFALPALGGYAALRERPELAEEALPPVLLERAEEGIAAQREGRGYAETELRMRGLVSSTIITNNLGVAFACFAGGIFAGVGSLLSLAFNGMMIGAASGHYHNVGLLAFLWTFVAGHGVLELFAIWCAGAAGFLLGLALVRPGEFSRRDALVMNARISMRLVGTAMVLLLVAGAIEGFFSTSAARMEVKVAVSVASAALLVAYLANGARLARRDGGLGGVVG